MMAAARTSSALRSLLRRGGDGGRRRGLVVASSRSTFAAPRRRSSAGEGGDDVAARFRGIAARRFRGNDEIVQARRVHRTSRRGGGSVASIARDDDEREPPTTTTTSAVPFLLADIGEGIAEVELLRWYVVPGASIEQFDPVCDVQSDKASVEITSRYDGRVDRLCGEAGDVMRVGAPLLWIETEGGGPGPGAGTGAAGGPEEEAGGNAAGEGGAPRLEPPAATPHRDAETQLDPLPAEDPAAGPRAGETTTRALASPAVRRLGKEHGIDLTNVAGTGPDGRVLKADVLRLLEPDAAAGRGSSATTLARGSSAPSAGARPPVVPSAEGDAIVPLRGYRRLMAKSMTSSLEVPHMVYADEVRVDALTEVRDSLRPLARERGVEKLTYLPFFLKAASLAMTEHPEVNATIDLEGMEMRCHARHDVGVAVDTDRGLAVPVVRNCEARSVLEIAVELGRLHALVSATRTAAGPSFFSRLGRVT